jgi:hypothetical protein
LDAGLIESAFFFHNHQFFKRHQTQTPQPATNGIATQYRAEGAVAWTASPGQYLIG